MVFHSDFWLSRRCGHSQRPHQAVSRNPPLIRVKVQKYFCALIYIIGCIKHSIIFYRRMKYVLCVLLFGVFTISLTYSFLLILTEKCKESCQDKFVNNNPALLCKAPSTLSTDQHRDFETRVYMKIWSFWVIYLSMTNAKWISLWQLCIAWKSSTFVISNRLKIKIYLFYC